MLPPPSQPPALDYLRSSPVRGQLEPQDPRTAKGWRFIQTTDTLNQLKVLLPPGTANMYEQLLRFEAFELSKKSHISWERILEIRHLKDRMIRKCQKLAKSSVGGKPLDPLSFQTVIAPADFRLKEMEAWFHEQQKRTDALLRQSQGHQAGNPNCSCPQCAQRRAGKKPAGAVLAPRVGQSASAQPQTQMVTRRVEPARIDTKKANAYSTATRPAATSLRGRGSVAAATSSIPTRTISSPQPLPILLRPRDLDSGYDLSIDPQRIVSVPLKPQDRSTPATPVTPATPAGDEVKDESKVEATNEDPTPSNEPDSQVAVARPELRRRRSCLRRQSTGELKSVTWADGHEIVAQAQKIVFVANEAENSGRQWNEIREIYLEQMGGLEALQQQVEQSLVQLKSESENLARVDETIKQRRESLRRAFEDMEKTQRRLHAKVQETMEDAERVLIQAQIETVPEPLATSSPQPEPEPEPEPES